MSPSPLDYFHDNSVTRKDLAAQFHNFFSFSLKYHASFETKLAKIGHTCTLAKLHACNKILARKLLIFMISGQDPMENVFSSKVNKNFIVFSLNHCKLSRTVFLKWDRSIRYKPKVFTFCIMNKLTNPKLHSIFKSIYFLLFFPLQPACEGTAHQDNRQERKDCWCVEEEVERDFCTPLAHLHIFVSWDSLLYIMYSVLFVNKRNICKENEWCIDCFVRAKC